MGRPRGYAIGFVVLTTAMIVAGAMAVSLIVTGDPVYPVHVFGDARPTKRNFGFGERVRPEKPIVVPQGHISPNELLPLPPTPTWSGSGGDVSADAVYRAAAAMGVQKDLDKARVAVQHNQRAEALAIYERLGRAMPDFRPLIIERANVYSMFNMPHEAATFLQSRLARFPNDVELRMLAAHNAWWSDQPVVADSLAGLALALQPGNEEALRLRNTIRTTSEPPLAVAERWVREGGGPREYLLLARALVREGQYGRAVGAYEAALAPPRVPTDSLLLEAAGAAEAADSVGALDRLTHRYLAVHPGDAAAELRLARAYDWRGDYAKALQYYEMLPSPEPDVQFEIAQTLVWSGNEREAATRLRALVAAHPNNPQAYQLLGDLASWQGQWAVAMAYYQRARQLHPGLPGLDSAYAVANASLQKEAADLREQQRLASLQSRPTPQRTATAVSVQAWGDNQRFGWIESSASQLMPIARGAIRATALHRAFQSSVGGALARNPGLGMQVGATYALSSHAQLDAMAGVDQWSQVGTFPVYSAAVTLNDLLGTSAVFQFSHESAARELGSLAALQASALYNAASAAVTSTRGAYTVAGTAEAMQISTRAGGARRLSSNASVTRTLTERWSANANVSALTFDRAAPVVPGIGPAFWAPNYYVEPTVGASYTAGTPRGGLSGGAGVSLGYGLVSERANDRRFAGSAAPIGNMFFDMAYNRGPWLMSLDAAGGGAFGRGYRSGTLTLKAQYTP